MDTRASATQQTRPLSIHRTFILRLYADMDPSRHCIGGHVEHVVSGEGGDFSSIEDLLRIISRTLQPVS